MTSRAQTQKNRDIREWAASVGYDLEGKQRIPAAVRRGWEEAKGERSAPPDAPLDESDAPPDPDDEMERLEQIGRSAPPNAPPEGLIVEPSASAERAPVEPKRRRLWERAPGPKTSRRRESLETMGQFLWGGLAQMMARSGRQPTSRILAMQAPIAGVLLDDVVRGTLVDRLLQPFARSGKKGEALFALVGPPLLVEAIIRYPERQETLLPILAAALEQYADIAGPKLASAKRRAEKRAQDIGADGGIQGLLAWIFEAPEGSGAGDQGASRAA